MHVIVFRMVSFKSFLVPCWLYWFKYFSEAQEMDIRRETVMLVYAQWLFMYNYKWGIDGKTV